MKTKRFFKKLALNKISIARLDNKELRQVKGGGVIYEETVKTNIDPPCHSNCSDCETTF